MAMFSKNKPFALMDNQERFAYVAGKEIAKKMERVIRNADM